MRIAELRLLRYGKFTGHTLTLPAGGHDIHLIVGPNEAGKSTVRHAISDWLFGFPERTPHAFLHPMNELRLGGLLESATRPIPGTENDPQHVQAAPIRRRKAAAQSEAAATGSLFGDDVLMPADQAAQVEETILPPQARESDGSVNRLEFERTKGRKNTLRTPDDSILPDDTLRAWIGHLQREAFTRMYALDHTTLVEGSEGMLRASDDLGRMLFQSAAGIENLGHALEALRKEAEALWGSRKSDNRRYYQAQKVFEQAKKDLAQAQLRTKDWSERHQALLDTERKLLDAQQRSNTIQQDIHRLERIRRVQPLLLALDASRQKLDALAASGMPPLLSDDAPQVFRQASQDRVLIEAELHRLQASVAESESALAALPVEQPLLHEAERITRLNEQRLQFRDHPVNLLKQREAMRGIESQVHHLARERGWTTDTEDSLRERLPGTPDRKRLHQLIREHGKCHQALRTAQTEQESSQRLLDQARQSLKALADSPLDDALHQAVDKALRLGDHEATMQSLQQQQESIAQRLEAALAGMGAWRQPLDTLVSMLAPDLTGLHRLIDQHQQDARELQSSQATRDALAAGIHQLEHEINRLMHQHQPVSQDDVQQARASRNRIWQGIRQDPASLPAQAGAFEEQTRQADELADARLARAQYEAQRQSSQDQLERKQHEHGVIAQQIATIEARMQGRLSAWLQQAESCGLPGLPLESAPVWLQQRQLALSLLEKKTSCDAQQKRLQDSISESQRTLWSLLHAGEPADAMPDLASCVREARKRISQQQQAEGQRQTLEEHIRQEQQNLVRLYTALQAARTEWQSWEDRWHVALAAISLDADTPVEQAEAQLAQLDRIDTLLENIRQLQQERIEPMQTELNGFADAARTLAKQVAPELIDRPAEDIALTLSNRLDDARRTQAEASALRKRIHADKSAHDACLQRQIAVQASITPLLKAANVQDPDALGRCIDASTQRRQLEQALADTEQQLIAQADGKTLDELREECASISPDALMARLDDLRQQAAHAVDDISTLSRLQGQQKTDLDAMDGSDAAARALARQHEAIADMSDAAERYLQVQTAVRLLSWSIEKFRERRQGPMLKRASQLFSTLTRGSFSRLLVDTEQDDPELFGIRETGGQITKVAVSGMSEGSRDQLYLALRLAALDMQAEQGQSMPLIADDLFINFDNQRTAAGLQVLGELSRRMQVIFLTHHDHLVPLARKVLGNRLNVIELA